MSYRATVYLRVAAIIGLVIGGFVVLEAPFRKFEAHMSVVLLEHLGAHNEVSQLIGSSEIAVFPAHQQAFIAIVTPSCSSLAAMLAVLTLGAVAPHPRRARKYTALLIASCIVVIGNILRIASALAVGLVDGRASLVLFHDWVGGIFTFIYILGAYILFLFMLLPHERPAPLPPSRVAV